MVEPFAALDRPLADVRDDAPIVEAATVFEGKVFDVNRETVAFGGGTMVREYSAHHGAVAVLAIDDDDRILLINQYRHPVRTRLWEIPAGLLDVEGEDPLAAAQRELAEETDLVADRWSLARRPLRERGGHAGDVRRGGGAPSTGAAGARQQRPHRGEGVATDVAGPDQLPQRFFERGDPYRGAHSRNRHLHQRFPGRGNDRGEPQDDGGRQPSHQQQ